MAKFSINIQQGTLEKDKKHIVGIDLGTTNSLVAAILEGEAVALAEEKHPVIVPSIVHLNAENQFVVGEEARPLLLQDPEHTVFSVKRLMGKSYQDVEGIESKLPYRVIDEDEDRLVKIRLRDKYLTPIELSAQILKKLKAKAEKVLDAQVEQAVITVPAYFNDAQRQATRDAGRLAGLDVLRIVNEPTAAALSYGLNEKADGETIAVYDLGGGTFDISILQIHDGIFEVLSTYGDSFLGGDDFDRALVEYWIDTYGLEDADQAELRLLAEEAKIKLTGHLTVEVNYQGDELEITKQAFNKLIRPLVHKTLDACQQAVEDSGMGIKKIDKVVMVGGSTRVPLVKQSVADFFDREVFDQIDPDQVVALGAAIQADILAGNRKDLLLLDITPLSLGIETVGGLMDVLIPRNSKVPARLARNYTTSVDGQKNLKVAVYQGERDMVRDNRKLGEFILKGIPPMAAGLPKIEIRFLLDADGILKVEAKELRSGVEQSIDIKPSYGITEEEMARMLKESIKYASKDMQEKALMEARVEAENILYSTDKFIKQNEEWLDQEVIDRLIELKSELQAMHESGSKDEINAAMEKLNDYSRPYAQQAMERGISGAMKGKSV